MSFDNCTQAYAAGRSNIPKSDPMYGKHLDRDNDGIGCDNPPPGFQTKPATAPGDTSTGTQTETGAGTGTTLPKTGPAMDLGIGGGVVLLVGLAAAVIARRRKMRFTA